jgi:hypothetical protein
LYELHMFQSLAETLPAKVKGFELSALLESFAIYLLNLIDFFYVAPMREHDVVAADFFDDPSALSPGGVPASLEAARERANKEISHITHKRKTGADPTKPWAVTALFGAINPVAKKFAAEASKKKLHPDVVEWLNASPDRTAVLLVDASKTTTNTASAIITISSS